MNGPTTVRPPAGLSPAPRPAHQQPPSAHQQQPEHALQLTHQPPAGPPTPEMINKEKFLQQQVHEIPPKNIFLLQIFVILEIFFYLKMLVVDKK